MIASRWRTWLQLFRAPNLFTVPGDPLAGYLLAVHGSFNGAVLWALAASLSFYAAGLLMNDLADLEEDRRERPQRPLPGGAASPRAAWIVSFSLVAAGLAMCAFINGTALGVGALLAGAMAFYNFCAKRVAVLGALNMGLCRGLNVLLGAAAAGFVLPPSISAACLTAVYIAAVTHLSRFETKPTAPTLAKILPLLALVAGPLFFPVRQPHVNPATFFVFMAIPIAAGAAISVRLLRPECDPLPPAIGAFIRVLLPLQAAFCAGSNTGWIGGGPALLLLALTPVSRIVSRRFYAS